MIMTGRAWKLRFTKHRLLRRDKQNIIYTLAVLLGIGFLVHWRYTSSLQSTNLPLVPYCKDCTHETNVYYRFSQSEVSDPEVCAFREDNIPTYQILVEKSSYTVGDTVQFTINLNNGSSVCKSRGSDILFLRAMTGDHCISIGTMVDHLNGTYTGRIKLRWPGTTQIVGVVAESRQKFMLQKSCILRYGKYLVNRFILGEFEFLNYRERTECLPTTVGLASGPGDVCNMTKENYDLSWYCERPVNPNLQCSDIKRYCYGRSEPKGVRQYCLTLDLPEVNGVIVPTTIDVKDDNNKPNGESSEAKLPPCTDWNVRSETWMKHKPSGYVDNSLWKSTYCRANIENTYADYKTCLRNTHIAMYGDSTLRQWYTYFNTMFETTPVNTYTLYRLSIVRKRSMNMSMSWTTHAMPYQFTNYYADIGSFRSVSEYLYELTKYVHDKRTEIHRPQASTNVTDERNMERKQHPKIYLFNQLDIANRNIIIIIGVALHVQQYDPWVFKSRIRNIAHAVNYLTTKLPDVKVFIKGPHARDGRIHMLALFNDIIRDEFHHLSENIFYLDQWSITVAFGDYATHSAEGVLSNMIYQMLAHVCM